MISIGPIVRRPGAGSTGGVRSACADLEAGGWMFAAGRPPASHTPQGYMPAGATGQVAPAEATEMHLERERPGVV